MSEERTKRNEVFTQQPVRPAGVDPAIQSVSAFDAVKAEFGLDVPVETVPLPSNGLVYPVGSPLHGVETVDIRSMTAREEDILTNRALLKKGTVITELIRSCLMNKDIDPAQLLAGDRNALMVAIRVTGYGHEYDAEVECSNAECEHRSARPFNLAELEIQRLKITPVVEGSNLFEFRLPVSQKNVAFRFLTGADEENITVTQEKLKKVLGAGSAAGSTSVTSNLLASIVSIDSNQDRSKIAQFVKMMPARDSLALRNYIREQEPGIKMRQETSCPACGNVEEVNIPMGVTFLWPAAR